LHQQEEFNAYVLIKVESGKDVQVFSAIRDLKDIFPVKSLSMVYGEYDIITRIQGNTPEDVQKFVFEGVRSIEGVKDTKTFIVAKFLLFK
jgi:DNA-binding Lrp family transcriptional regulator